MVYFELCDFCACTGSMDEMTPVHIKKDGRTFTFWYHNTVLNPCLKAKIEELRERFSQPQ
jgi:hypothetical protein